MNPNIDKKTLHHDITPLRRFQYRLGNVSLEFTLRFDQKQDRKDFLEVIKKAKEDVQASLENEA